MDDDNVEDDYEKFLQATAIQAAEKALEKVSIDEDDESSVLSSVCHSMGIFNLLFNFSRSFPSLRSINVDERMQSSTNKRTQ